MQYWLPARKTRSLYYQAPNSHLPEGGMPMHESFLFNPLLAMDTQEVTRTYETDCVIWDINGSFNGAGVFAQIYQVHNGKQRALFNKHRPLDSVAGSGSPPGFLLSPLAVAAGDSIMVEVKSLDRVNSQNVEVVLFGNSVDQMNPYQKIIWDRKMYLLDKFSQSPDVAGTNAPPPDARPLVLTSTALTQYPAPGAAAVIIFSYQVPRGQRAHIFRHALVNLAGGQVDMVGQIIWRFLVNGAPLKGLGAQISTIGTFQTPDEVVINLTENDLLQVTVEVAAAAPQPPGNTAYRIIGWTAPALKGDRK